MPSWYRQYTFYLYFQLFCISDLRSPGNINVIKKETSILFTISWNVLYVYIIFINIGEYVFGMYIVLSMST